MKAKKWFTFGLIFFILLVSASFSLGSSLSIPFITVDQGAISYYRYDDPGFCGLDMLIKDQKTWAKFWAQHTAGITPAPPLPKINFGKEMVVVTLLGYQTSGGGPSTKVLEVNLDDKKPCCLRILIEDNETPGPLCVITNPFHIIRLKKIDTHSIVFEHQRPPQITPPEITPPSGIDGNILQPSAD